MSRRRHRTIQRLIERDGAVCWLCELPLSLLIKNDRFVYVSLDHVIPRVVGGKNEDGNFRLAHKECNGRRGARLPRACVDCGECAPPLRWDKLHPRCYGCEPACTTRAVGRVG